MDNHVEEVTDMDMDVGMVKEEITKIFKMEIKIKISKEVMEEEEEEVTMEEIMKIKMIKLK